VSVGSSVHVFDHGDMTFNGSAEHDESIGYSLVGGELTPDPTAVGGTFDMRITGKLGSVFYTGFEFSVGGADVRNPRTMSSGTEGHKLEPGNALYLSGGGLVGASLPIGDFTLKAEVFGGGRTMGLNLTSKYGECVTQTVAWGHGLMLEQRVAVQKWLTPWTSINAWAGTSALQDNDVAGGVYFSGHIRAFDGMGR
jgi:hypothetical protein